MVKTTPAVFANDVDPSLDKIAVTFDRPMMDKNWSFTGGDATFSEQTGAIFPQRTGEISYDAARTTRTMPVKLQPGKVYWVGVNSPSFQNFKSPDGTPAKRYLILFATKSADGKPTPLPEDLVSSIKPRQAEAYVTARLSSGASAATVNKDIRTRKAIFKLAIEPRGYLQPTQNPFARIRQRKESPRPLRYVTPQEIGALVKAAPSLWWKALLLLAYTSGARVGEIFNLTWADLDFENDRIRVVRKRDEAGLPDWEPKDHEGRVLPAPAEVMQLLTDLHVTASEGCPYVFVPSWRWAHVCSARQTSRWRNGQALVNNLNRNLRVLRKKARIARLTLHDLRRSCLTNWARSSPIHVVRRLAGHSDLNTTQQYYLAVQEDDLEKARQVQSEILNGALTDQELTNSAPNGLSDGRNAKRPNRAIA